MKVQLSKTKTIDIKFPKGKRDRSSGTDLVGLELFHPGEDGVRAVRILRRKNDWQLLAASKINAPEGELPTKWDDLSRQTEWELPREFQSPSAALAVHSAESSFGQASSDAIIREMVQGLAISEAHTPNEEPRSKFRVRREEPTPAANPPRDGTKTPTLPQIGEPTAENGRRFVLQPFAEENFYLRSSLPEFQVLWLSRLLPEGKRPTASSIQLSESALMASILAQPFFKNAKGDALVVFVRPAAIYFAGYHNGEPVLWRQCPGAQGENAMRKAVMNKLGVTDDLVDAVLEDSLVDPRPALDPFLHPVLDQLELSRAYLSGKFNMNIERAYLLGLSAGAIQWQRYAEEMLHLILEIPNPFEGFNIAKGVNLTSPHEYLTALGAALAASEVYK